VSPSTAVCLPVSAEPPFDWRDIPDSEHLVQFYESDIALLNSLYQFVGASLGADEHAIVVATKAHRDGLDELLRHGGFDVDALRAGGKYQCLDAVETLATFMVDGFPDPKRFAETVGGLICRAAGGGTRVRIFGEMVALLWAEENRTAAIRLEELWNDLRREHPFSLLCAYPMAAIDGDSQGPMTQICRTHSIVIPGESYMDIPEEYDRHRAIVALQQKARMLEAEIEHRREVEKQLRESREELKDFVENAIDGLHRVGPDGIILWANRAELEMLGYSAEEYVGHHISEFHAEPNTASDILSRLERRETLRNYEAKLRRKDGAIRQVLINSNVRWKEDKFQYTRCFTRDVTDRKRLQQAELFLGAIIASANDAIVTKTPEGIITSWNPAAQTIFGYTEREAIGKSITILIPEDRSHEETEILAKVHRGEHINHYETQRIRKDGRIIDVSITISPVKDDQDRIIGVSKVARDITDRKHVETRREELLQREREARFAAEQANRMKDDFLATVSHELRTPLNAIIGWCHMLRFRSLDASMTARAIETIDRNAKAQAQLIEDILDVSRVIAGKLQLNLSKVDLSATINSAIDAVQLAADSKGIQLEVLADPKTRNVTGDATRLQQIVWNLLSNAIKFTPEGGKVSVRLQRTGSDAEITVTDTGQGIEPEFIPFIFERFSQADATTTRRHSGLGLGLAIVRHLVELHGGTVLASSPGKGLGATFAVRLPLISVFEATDTFKAPLRALPAKSASRGRLSVPTLHGIRVLVVDDNLDSLNLVASHLADHRATVEIANSAAEALAVLQWYRPQQ